ncbi:ubiquitin C-terminal hydrolase 12-like isoform X1 [Macadamia integrifolia]|uniref:ubiquitin C-terminal hydrolase 12-like isoform X1 n=1 Tax=Macadamia integrifolia TaxID=60698 RepID=UPI001C4E5EF4|nr:ubiquitin C-terminal hydrolase 12-like isoform X1 [Macadamia integrifolia]
MARKWVNIPLAVSKHSNTELRLLGISCHRICVNYPPSKKIKYINDWGPLLLRVEEIPEEEKNVGPGYHLVPVFHFKKDTSKEQRFFQYFDEPFFLIIHERETLAEIKVHIQEKLQFSNKKFDQLKFSFISSRGLTSRQDLHDSDIVYSHF